MPTHTQPVAIITAAGRGMGAAIAQELAQSHTVVLMSTSDSASQRAQQLGGWGMKGSVTQEADLQRIVSETLERYGRIDAVVNNTGHPPKGDLLVLSDDEWYAGLDMVLLNVVRMARLVTPVMERQGGGAIVNISTFAAFEPELGFPVSSTLRAALGSFAKLYAERYAAQGIRMNNILPGYIDSYEVSDTVRERIPMHRAGKVQEIAQTTAFLLSPAAGYITGQNLRVDGGLTRGV